MLLLPLIAKFLITHRPKAAVPEDLNSPCCKPVDVHSRHQPHIPFLNCEHSHLAIKPC